MENYAKPGYSTKEVAQIIGCTPCTVRAMVMSGRMKGRISGPEVIPGKKRKIRIFREDLANYIWEHQGQFDKALVQQFSKYRTGYPDPGDRPIAEKAKQDKEVKVNENGDTSVPTGALADLVHTANIYRADHEKAKQDKEVKVNENGDTSVPTGALADLVHTANIYRADQEYKEAIKGVTTYAEKEPIKTERAVSYMVLVNGRIAVGNVTVDTAKIIAGALLADTVCEVESVEIKKLKKGE